MLCLFLAIPLFPSAQARVPPSTTANIFAAPQRTRAAARSAWPAFLVTSNVQGWEEVKFDNTDLYEGCVDSNKIANTAEPLPRGGHAMESAGVTALMCGGLGDGGVKLEDSDGSIDCWWLTPVPLARWDKLELEPGSAKPPARSGHSMGYDVDRNIISMIGGQDKNNNLLKVMPPLSSSLLTFHLFILRELSPTEPSASLAHTTNNCRTVGSSGSAANPPTPRRPGSTKRNGTPACLKMQRRQHLPLATATDRCDLLRL